MYYNDDLSSYAAKYLKENGVGQHSLYETVDAAISTLGSRWEYGFENVV